MALSPDGDLEVDMRARQERFQPTLTLDSAREKRDATLASRRRRDKRQLLKRRRGANQLVNSDT